MTDTTIEVVLDGAIGSPGDSKPIVDLRPIDEFAADLTPPVAERKPYSQINGAIESLKAKRATLKTQIKNLQSYPEDDSAYPDGTAMIWHDRDNPYGPDRHFVAVREEGRWYTAGEFHHLRWDELVSSRMAYFDFCEIEVVLPASSK